MKITINTKEDSNEDIRKVISLLSTLVKHRTESQKTSNIFENPGSSLNITEPESDQISSVDGPEKENAFANMFGDNNNETVKNIKEEEDKSEEKPEIIEY